MYRSYAKEMQEDSLYSGSSLQCTLSVEAMGQPSVSSVCKRQVCKAGELILGRNHFSEPVLQAHIANAVRSFSLEGVTIHRRFLKEGKSTLVLPKDKVQVLISNCPPDKLLYFLKTLVGKLARHKVNPIQKSSAREKLLNSCQEANFTEISPLCEQDVACAKASHPATTPTSSKSLKRRRGQPDPPELDKENINPAGSKVAKKSISLSSGLSELTPQQYQVLEAITSGHNVFITGGAGTGKSFLLRRALGSLPPEHTFTTASTGIAASHISGMTLHSFAGIGSGRADLDKCIELANQPVVAAQWRKCRHLIIDEISMIAGEYFAKLEAVARVVRKTDAPFGGIQLIVCGDFFQLPPVNKLKAKEKSLATKFAFQTNAWRKCIQKTIQLKEVKRQTDSVFINILNELRTGKCHPRSVAVLKSTASHQLNRNELQATSLSTHNDDVEAINDLSLQKLPGERRSFLASDSDTVLSNKINDLCPVKKEVVLKTGAQVMICKNINTKEGLVNGTRAVVVGFENNSTGFPIVKTVDGRSKVIKTEVFMYRWSGGITLSRRQLPLKLAWAISIHKSQGMTLDLVEISLSRVFEYGQAYVALSRARSLQGLKVLDFTVDCVKAHPDVRQFYQRLDCSR